MFGEYSTRCQRSTSFKLPVTLPVEVLLLLEVDGSVCQIIGRGIVELRFYALSAIFRARTYIHNLFSPVMMIT